MPVYGHFRASGTRPGVYAGLAAVLGCTCFCIYLCHARLRASCSEPNTAFGKQPCKVRNAPGGFWLS